MRSISKFALLAALLASQTSCVPVAVLGGAGALGYTAAEDRSVGTAIDDASIETQINAKFVAQGNRKDYAHITEDSNEGRVLLTGYVPDRQTRINAYNLVWQVAGVKQVMNELKVDSNAKFSAKQYASDAWISTQIESRLLFTRDVKSINYSIETIEGVVYLMGIAQSKDELDTVTSVASEVPGVQKVISYVRVKTAAEIAASQRSGSYNADRNSVSVDEEPVGTVPGSTVYEPQESIGSSQGYSAPAVVIEESPNAQ